MAERRMFARGITDDDEFIELSSSAQALYLHLCMSADDDGFSKQISISMFKAHASTQDLESLINRGYVIQFESGVIVIRHWKVHNYIQKDRYKKTTFKKEASLLSLDEGLVYNMDTSCIQPVSNMDTTCEQPVSVGKDRLGKDRLELGNNNICSNSDDFERFWKLYPKKIGKGNAQKAFNKAIKKAGVNVQVLIDAVETQKCSERWKKNNGEFIPLPATWLNQERWGDDLAEVCVSIPMYTELEEGELPF